MPFIEKQDRTEREELKVKIRPEVTALVREYAAFLESEEWYIVQEVLRKSLESDKEFQRWRRLRSGETPEVEPPLKKGKAA